MEAVASQTNDIHGNLHGIDHLTIPVHDMAKAERFYIGLLGGQLLMRIDEAFLRNIDGAEFPPERQAELGGPSGNSPIHTSILMGQGPRIDLFLQPFGQPGAGVPHPHLAFRVQPQLLRKLTAALQAHGVPTDGPRRLGPPGQASVYFNDPFGNHLEFTTMGFAEEIPIGPPDMKQLTYQWRG